MRKIIIILALLVLLTGCANPINNQSQNRNQNKDSNNITVQEVSNLMLEDWQKIIIIKDDHIIYRGKPDEIDQNLLNESVLKIANTEDNYNNDSITLIIE